jgi:2-C-methyl-D-erythritol 4-phosphate cytidylyltransferase
MTENPKYVIVVAGGSGTRMGADIPKQFIEVAGLPVLMHTLNVFFQFDPTLNLILVLPENQHLVWYDLIKKHQFNLKHLIAKGGGTRFHSVLNGLNLITGSGLVAVHDGVRPLVSQHTIAQCFAQANQTGAVVPVVPINESVRQKTSKGSVAVNRADYFLVQTPQVFAVDILQKAYRQAYSDAFTDDASVVEAAGYPIALVEGNVENIKITRPFDFSIMAACLQVGTP